MTSSQALGPDSHRSIDLVKIGEGRYKATNARGGETFLGRGGEDPDFTPVELLLAAIAGCSAIDVEAITAKRATATSFEAVMSGDKVRDDKGNHLTNLRLAFDITFPEGEDGDRAREVLGRAIGQSRDRLCSVGRTVQLGEEVTYEGAEPERA